MKKPILLSLLFVLCLSCSSEKNSVSGKYLKKYMNTISEESLKTDLTIVASDEMEGRETGSEGKTEFLSQKAQIVFTKKYLQHF